MHRYEIEKMFEPEPDPDLGISDSKNLAEVLRCLNEFKQFAILTACNVGDAHSEERRRFVEHVWKAYVIAASAAKKNAFHSHEIIASASEYALGRFFRSKVSAILDRESSSEN